MKKILLLMSFAFLVLINGIPVVAGDLDPLFISVTTDDPYRASMAITFGGGQLDRGHPLTIYLNDRGVFLGSRAYAARFSDNQKVLVGLTNNGATVIICPACMKHYGISEADLIPGVKIGDPDLTGNALFRDNTKILTW